MGTVSSLLTDHVSFRGPYRGTGGYVPGLQYEGGILKFLLNHGFSVPSPAALNKNPSGWSPSWTPWWLRRGCRWSASRKTTAKRTLPAPTKTRLWPRATSASSWLARPKSGRARGGASSIPPTPAPPGPPALFLSRVSSVPDQWSLYFADKGWGPDGCRVAHWLQLGPGHLWSCHRLTDRLVKSIMQPG
jgi:hypothetical protein